MEEQILEVAQRLFTERGYALTSTTDIAKEVGCNQALVHYYFRSKEKLFLRVFDEKMRLFLKVLFAPLPPQTSFADMIRTRVESHFNLLAQNPKLPFLVINELSTNPDRIEAIKQNLDNFPLTALASLQEELDSEYAAGRIRKTNARELVLNVISLNVFTFLALPMITKVLDLEEDEKKEAFLQTRKEEIIKIILRDVIISN